MPSTAVRPLKRTDSPSTSMSAEPVPVVVRSGGTATSRVAGLPSAHAVEQGLQPRGMGRWPPWTATTTVGQSEQR